jgi:beta-glucosidase
VADDADVALVFVGLPETAEVEGLDRSHLRLPAAHDALVEAVAARHPRVVVVVAAGAPVEMPWRGSVAAIVHMYLGGQAGGSAIADVLCGRSEPGGRLAETFPRALADHPVHAIPFGPRQTEYRESLYVGYRYYDSAGVEVAFPFGHGLSYTTFAWSQPRAVLVGEATVEVSVTVTNTGRRVGSEVVQVYVHDVASTVFRPDQELRAFTKLHLGPGQARRVALRLDQRAFAFWAAAGPDWVVEPGEFEIRLGASSRDIRAVLPVTIDAPPVAGLMSGPPSYHDLSIGFTQDDFAALYGGPLPGNVPEARGDYTLNTPFADIDHPLARAVLRLLRWGARRALRVREGSPAWLVAESTIADSTPRMLTMFLGVGIGGRAARLLLRLANRR